MTVLTMLEAGSRDAENPCDEAEIKKHRRSIESAAENAMTLSVASGKSAAGGCQAVFKSAVGSGQAGAMSKKISEILTRDLGKRRRLEGGAGATVSSSPTEEEVEFGAEPEDEDWSRYENNDKSGDSSGSKAKAEDGYGYGYGADSLKSAGIVLRACGVVTTLALALAAPLFF